MIQSNESLAGNILAVNVTSFAFSPQSFSSHHQRHHISDRPAGITGSLPVFSAGLSYLKSIFTGFWAMPVSHSVCSLAWTRNSVCLSLIWHSEEIQKSSDKHCLPRLHRQKLSDKTKWLQTNKQRTDIGNFRIAAGAYRPSTSTNQRRAEMSVSMWDSGNVMRQQAFIVVADQPGMM